MPNRNYRKGYRNEAKTIAVLEAAGYQCVRAGGSHGVFDVVGLCRGGVVLVQVKSNDWPSPVEVEAIREYAVPDNASKLIHRWRDRQSSPDVRTIT